MMSDSAYTLTTTLPAELRIDVQTTRDGRYIGSVIVACAVVDASDQLGIAEHVAKALAAEHARRAQAAEPSSDD